MASSAVAMPLKISGMSTILLDPLDVAPVELRLIDAGVAGAHAAALVALGDVALAPAVAVGVDRQAKRVVALVHRAPDMVVDPGRVAAHIQLEDLEAVARGLGGFSSPGCDTEDRIMPLPNSRVAAATVAAAAGLEDFERADRRAQHRDAQLFAEQCPAAIDRSTRRAIPAAESRSNRAPAGCAPRWSRSRSRRSDSPNCCG